MSDNVHPPPVRDERGRIVAGTLNPRGRAARATEVAYLRAVQAACSPEDIAAIVAGIVTAAKGGDLAAAKLLFSILVPKPVAVEPEDEDEPVNKPRSAQEQAAELTRRFDAHEARGIPINPLAREAVQMIFNRPRLGDRPLQASSEDGPEDAA